MFYLVKQGIENIFRNKLMFIASVLIVATSMITLNVFLIIGKNVNNMVNNMERSQGIVVFLNNDVDEAQINNIGTKIKAVDGISKIEFESKEEALENARKEYFDETNMDLTAGWEENNIFSASFTVSLQELQDANKITEKLEKIEGVRKVVFDNEIFNMITKISDLVRIVVMVIFILLVGISFLVISNTIKLVLHSRRKEINIMKYIGATDGFVETPFIVEGIFVGSIGALVSWGLSTGLYSSLIGKFSGAAFWEFVPLNFELLKVNLIIGILVSCIACLMSIRRYLKV